MKAYCISGLGADHRAFARLQLHHTLVPVKWLAPFSEESLAQYCQRLVKQIDTSEKFILIGVSFGGMIACELNKHIRPEHTFIISSAAQASELPAIYRLLGKIRLASWLPRFMLIPPTFILAHLFGIKTASDKSLLKNILKDTDPVFARWAIDKITRWKNKQVPLTLTRIQGDKDKVLPHLSTDAQVIKGGEHFMIIDRADEISAIINHHS